MPDFPPGGVDILATGRYLPQRVVTNAELETLMDTSDEWIVQRTGIRERRAASDEDTTVSMAAEAVATALRRAGLTASDMDLLVLASVGSEMSCPATACVVLDRLEKQHGLGRTTAGAFDLVAACSGFVYGLNLAASMIRTGAHKRVAVVGVERLTDTVEYSTRGRGTAILFGDGAGAVILGASDVNGRGVLAQRMYADGSRWGDLYIPTSEPRDFPEGKRAPGDELPLRLMRMNGRSVFRFAVGTFCDLIKETLDDAGLTAEDVDAFICHQSNARIIEAARERFGLPAEKMPVNIDRIGNTSAASVPILFDEQREAGNIQPGQTVMFVAFGGGLTWSSSLWKL